MHHASCVIIGCFEKAALCTPCAHLRYGTPSSLHMGNWHGVHKVSGRHGAHKGLHKCGCKGTACAHLVPSTYTRKLCWAQGCSQGCANLAHTRVPHLVRTRVRTAPGALKSAQNIFRRKGFVQTY